MASGVEPTAERTATPECDVDAVQELIGRVEDMLATLDEWGDENSGRLRRKLNETVSAARGSLWQTEERGVHRTPSRLPGMLTAVSIAALSGFLVGYLATRLE